MPGVRHWRYVALRHGLITLTSRPCMIFRISQKPHPVIVYLKLSYVQLTISFLIGRKSTVNFRNQCLGRHLAADYTIITSRSLKVTGNHVMYDRGTWFLRVMMSRSRALCCLPSVKKQKHYFQVCFFDLARQGLTNTKRSTKVAKELLLITWKRKNWENLRKRKKLARTLNLKFVEARKKGFVQCIIRQLLDSVFVISRIIKTLFVLDIAKISSNNCL